MKNSLINFSIVLVTLVISFFVGEIIIRNTHIGERFGWQTFAPLDERVQNAKSTSDEKINVGIFGDSFVEYFRNTSKNFVFVAENAIGDNKINLLNFGYFGTGIRNYLANFEYVINSIRLDGALFVIYSGNDYSDYFMNNFRIRSKISVPDESQPKLVDTRNLNVVTRTLKKSILLNYLYRHIIKRYFGGNHEDFRKLVYDKANLLKVEHNVESAMSRLPDDLIAAAEAGVINRHTVATGITYPRYFVDLHDGWGSQRKELAAEIRADVSKILDLCKIHDIKCGFVFIDASVFVNKKYHQFYEMMGYVINETLLSKPYHSKWLQEYLSGTHIEYFDAYEVLSSSEQRLFLKTDDHLNAAGNAVIGEKLAIWLRRVNFLSRP